MQNNITLSVLVVNWNGEQYIGNCLQSLTDTIKKYSYEIIVVDNNSSDGSCNLIKKSFKDVLLIENSKNEMFAKANNIAYVSSKGKYIAVVNPDIVVKAGVVDDLVEALESTTDTAFTTVLYNEDGTIQNNMHRGFPTFGSLFLSMLCVNKGWFCATKKVKKYLLSDLDFTQDHYIDQAPGAFLFLKREHINKIEYLFDEDRFPLFYNDVDLCYRLWSNGISIMCKVTDGAFHLKGAAVKTLKFDDSLFWKLSGAKKYFYKYNKRFDYLIMSLLLFFFSLLKRKRK